MTWRSRPMMLAAGVAAILLVTVVLGRDGDVVPGTPAARRVPNARTASGGPAVTDLKLELLQQAREDLGEPGRDPFRFQARQAAPRPAPAAPPPETSTSRPVIAGPPVPAGPPPVPPIALRFIGLVEAPTQAGRVAILSDGRGNVVYGREGDTIEGRYRLLRVGADAVELAYVDGRGRQTVRLAGQ